MSPGASIHWRPSGRADHHGTGWATVIAILFAAVAAISFAVDQSITLSSLPAGPPTAGAGR